MCSRRCRDCSPRVTPPLRTPPCEASRSGFVFRRDGGAEIRVAHSRGLLLESLIFHVHLCFVSRNDLDPIMTMNMPSSTRERMGIYYTGEQFKEKSSVLPDRMAPFERSSTTFGCSLLQNNEVGIKTDRPSMIECCLSVLLISFLQHTCTTSLISMYGHHYHI